MFERVESERWGGVDDTRVGREGKRVDESRRRARAERTHAVGVSSIKDGTGIGDRKRNERDV